MGKISSLSKWANLLSETIPRIDINVICLNHAEWCMVWAPVTRHFLSHSSVQKYKEPLLLFGLIRYYICINWWDVILIDALTSVSSLTPPPLKLGLGWQGLTLRPAPTFSTLKIPYRIPFLLTGSDKINTGPGPPGLVNVVPGIIRPDNILQNTAGVITYPCLM